MTWTHDLPPEPPTPDVDDPLWAIQPTETDQRVTLQFGDGTACRIGDNPRPGMTWDWTDIRRDVWVARLRAIADYIEDDRHDESEGR